MNLCLDTVEFDDMQLSSPCRAAHLTNDAVQKQLEGYHSHEDHSKLSLEELQDNLASNQAQVGLCVIKTSPLLWSCTWVFCIQMQFLENQCSVRLRHRRKNAGTLLLGGTLQHKGLVPFCAKKVPCSYASSFLAEESMAVAVRSSIL